MADICFTGHRRLGPKAENLVKPKLEFLIDLAIRKGKREFIAGGAMGVDHWAAEIVLTKPEAILTVALPHPEYDQTKWDSDRHREFNGLLTRLKKPHKCFFVHSGREPYKDEHPLDRNKWMVDNSRIVFGVWDGVTASRPSGTLHCLRYAWEKGRLTINISPDSGEMQIIRGGKHVRDFEESDLVA